MEELLAERGIEVSREAVRTWAIKFGPLFAKNLRRRQPRPTGRWRLDEMVVKIGGEKRWLWRAVDDEGVVLDTLNQRRRNREAALRLLRKLLKTQVFTLRRSRRTNWPPMARRCANLALSERHRCNGRRSNNRAENSHLPIRRRE